MIICKLSSFPNSPFNSIDLQKFTILTQVEGVEIYDLEALTDHVVVSKSTYSSTLHLTQTEFDQELNLLLQRLEHLNQQKIFDYYKLQALNHWKQLVVIILLEWIDVKGGYNVELKSLMAQVLNYIEGKLEFGEGLSEIMKNELMEVVWWGGQKFNGNSGNN
ncbi:hypothetical protein CONCODRAFT_12295 [Conidiobolus coronatus NRRL 28638]|uniref:Uncharacterized protein n=1 Tax=Conidiobolus coronatus (strain ATCC 28846 / CBS 209.66 / NRRL 28638) TaxID=796925 RepID=A0A137NTG3_CONC2|nr:hypothetical protein CONCODRAFT_12295 [Conidiobolus coronatus NRRL 28638]|eukprot:KXN65978.1 hypothetical protein CONCODRAFT_12295 [Conidiobolus coronatus NRRL 28638]